MKIKIPTLLFFILSIFSSSLMSMHEGEEILEDLESSLVNLSIEDPYPLSSHLRPSHFNLTAHNYHCEYTKALVSRVHESECILALMNLGNIKKTKLGNKGN